MLKTIYLKYTLFINFMYNCHVQYFKTVPCKGAADALLWLKGLFRPKIRKSCNVPFSYLILRFYQSFAWCMKAANHVQDFFYNSSIAVSTNFHLKNAVHIL